MGIKPHSYSDEAYQALRSKIIEGELDFGSRLHIKDLAEELGVSSTPVREALNRLSTTGLAKINAHKGVFVMTPSVQDVKEMCKARLCLESCMAEEVIQNATDEQIEQLRWLSTQTSYESSTMGVHDYYATLASNSVLQRFYEQVQGVLTVLFGKAIRKPVPSHYLLQHSDEEKEIVDAVSARDVARLREAIRFHVQYLEEFLLASNVVK